MGGIYHIVNRGVDKRKVFMDNTDYMRFVDNLIDFNDVDGVIQSHYRRRLEESDKLTDIGCPSERLVDVLCWSLLPNLSLVILKVP